MCCTPSKKGHASAQPEDQHGDDQAPEVQLLAVAEGVLRRGRPLAEPDTHEQQYAVERVDGGVDTLGQHGGTAGDPGDDELVTAIATLAAMAP